ncbi:MAG: DUF58 domain-containing protein [Lachnospiraceae bacterium]|nr:DUF58 domain-containing protein [Lachnospiraceae bacterium]
MKLLIALLAGGLFYLAQLYLYRYLWDRDLNIDIDFEKKLVREGDSNRLIEVISNDKLLLLPLIQVKFSLTRTFLFKNTDNSSVTDRYYRNDFFSLLSYRKITRTYDFTCTRRGYYMMTDMDVICKDLLLTGMMLKSFPADTSLLVLPSRLDTQEIPGEISEFMGQVIDRIRKNEDPFEFAGIREYQPYDPMNRINWKASASGMKMMVNRFDTTYNRRIVIFLNTECHIKWHEDVFIEESIRLAASLACAFITDQVPVALYSNGCDAVTGAPVMIEEGADRAHLLCIETALARLDGSKQAGDFAGEIIKSLKDPRYERTECIIISNYRKQDLVDAYRTIKDDGVRISWIIPEYGMVEPKLASGGDRDIIKWTVGNAGWKI